jgi:hypothetical protein
MKLATLALISLLAVQPSNAADKSFIPPLLNRVLFQIQSGMTVPIVEGIIGAAYPNMTPQVGDWSGGGGTIIYRLDDHYTLAIACEEIANRRLVHRNVQFTIYERPANRRITLGLYTWNE